MDLDDLKKSFLRKSEEEKLDFIRNLRYTRTIDNSPPLKEKKTRAKKSEEDKLLEAFKKLNLSEEQIEEMLLKLGEVESATS